MANEVALNLGGMPTSGQQNTPDDQTTPVMQTSPTPPAEAYQKNLAPRSGGWSARYKQ